MKKKKGEVVDLLSVRKSFGLSQQDVARIIGVSKGYISAVENGRKSLSAEKEAQLINYLNVKSKANVTVKIDYLRVRLKTFQYEKVVKQLLQIPLDKFNPGRGGGQGYPCRIEHGNIKVYYQIEDEHSEENIDMGVLVEMTGEGCRLFEYFLEEQGRTWQTFFKDCWQYALKATRVNGKEDLVLANNFLGFPRIDIALDELYGSEGNYDLFKIWERVRQGKVRSLFRNFEPHEAFARVDGLFQSKGLSLAFGQKNGSVSFEFYEKDKEQALKKGLPLEEIHDIYGYKNRYEVRLTHDHAKQVIYDFAFEDGDLYYIAGAIVAKYLTVFDEEGDTDREWLEVLGIFKDYSFVTEPREISPEKRRRWIARQLLRELSIEYAVNKNTGQHFLMDSIKDYEFTEEDEQRIEAESQYLKNKEFRYEAQSTAKGRQFLKALGMTQDE